MSGDGAGRRRGRPRADAGGDTRAAILRAAREAFARHGYERATVRGIAHAAGVDPALVHHFFGSKEAVFGASVAEALAPVSRALGEVPETAGASVAAVAERLARVYGTLWEREPTRGALLGALRTAVGSERAAALVRSVVQDDVLGAVVTATGLPDAGLRANLIGATVVGVAIARHVLAVEPIASLADESLTAALAGVFEHCLTAELPAPA